MQVADVDLQLGLVTVRRIKGGKGRIAPFGPQTATAIDRYLRARRTHRLADTGKLWRGADNWRDFNLRRGTHWYAAQNPQGLTGSTRTRCGIPTPPGGCAPRVSEGGLMAVAGWSTRDMIDR